MTKIDNDSEAVVCFGEVLLRLTPPGRELLLQSGRFDAYVGGAEANVAVSLSKFGHRSRVVSALPANAIGRACADELRKHGVAVDAIKFLEGRMGVYYMSQGAGHRPSDVLYDRSRSAFSDAPGDLFDWSNLLSDASWLHLSGITPAVSATGVQAALGAVSAARQRGVKVSFDCNFRARVWATRAAEAPHILRQLCEQADLIFGDDRDIAFMLGIDAASLPPAERQRKAASHAFNAFPRLTWIASTIRTRHSVDHHSLAGQMYSRGESWTTRTWPLTSIIDRIGAGDAYAAGILHGLIEDMGPQRTLDFATAAACLKHSVPGDFNLIGVEDVQLALSESGSDVRR
jgi:2-dehydro-3-deoxygluconokinase